MTRTRRFQPPCLRGRASALRENPYRLRDRGGVNMHSKLQHPELPGALAHGARLRRADINDVPHLFTLEQELFPLDAWNLDMFLAEITHPTRTYYVLERAHSGENPQENPDEKNAPNIIGYCGVMTVADTADVQTIAVLPEYEGNGYGRAMLATMHRRAQDLGAQRILLEVRADNPRAQNLYLRTGYTHIHTRPGYYDDGTDALIMLKDFAANASTTTETT
ncbi:ribosomal-protein-alanine acetyltransferase [Rothia dentocariosa M567]|nr:ribosomal-protein-alanine acetyltransferase [Rothia dentocariosa M567]